MQPGDRLICAMVEPQPAGKTFKQWPLHVTIVPWFRAEVSSYDLSMELKESLSEVPAFEASIGKSANFGYQKNKKVVLVRLPSPFVKIEHRVRQILKSYKAWLADETTKSHGPYRPHVTDQANERLRENDKFYCNKLYIIEQKGNHKQVVAEVKLGHGKTGKTAA